MKENPHSPPPQSTSREISREEARRRRARLLAAQEAADAVQDSGAERDPADASLVTLFLPGG